MVNGITNQNRLRLPFILILLVLCMSKHNRKSKNTTIKLRKKKSYIKPEIILGRKQITRKNPYLRKTSTSDIDYVLDVCVENEAEPDMDVSAENEPDPVCVENEAESDMDVCVENEDESDIELCESDSDDSENLTDKGPTDVESLSPQEPLKPVLNTKSLFQVSIHPGQFTDIECFQSLFGLAKHVSTTEWNEAANYIQHSFGLQDGQVKHSWYPGTFSNPTLFSEKINKQLQQLDDNFATILTLRIMSPGPKMWGHYVVAYKSGQIYYFDPQNNIHSTNPTDLSQNPKNTVIRFGMFYVKDVTTPIPLKTNCP